MQYKDLKTIIVSGPKRSGTTMLNRLFDSQPGIIDLIDEAFFWEHVYKYSKIQKQDIFIDIFKTFSSAALRQGIIDRDIMPWIGGTYRQAAVKVPFEMDLGFNTSIFEQQLSEIAKSSQIKEIWFALVNAYARAAKPDYSEAKCAFIKSADYGVSIVSANMHLDDLRSIIIIRNPFYAIDSLKKSRGMRKEKELNPFNLGEVILDYIFLWNHLEDILKKKTILVQYENLLQDPSGFMNKIANHVEIEFSENLLNPTLQGLDWCGLSSFSKTNGIDRSVLDRSITALNEEEITFIENSLKEMLNHFNYTSTKQMPLS